jgi:hypothetical protein
MIDNLQRLLSLFFLNPFVLKILKYKYTVSAKCFLNYHLKKAVWAPWYRCDVNKRFLDIECM